MRGLLAGMILSALLLGRPAVAGTHSQGGEAGLALGAAVANLVYLPVKAVVALGGLVVGTFTGIANGGDTRSAYAFWVPAASGTYLLTPEHLDGSQPIEFFGTDYADTPSTLERGEASAVYNAMYQSR